MKDTQVDKIINIILKNPQKEWWRATDFMQSPEWFIGYEASARLSDIIREYYYAFETRKVGKFREVRYRKEDRQKLIERYTQFAGKYLELRMF